MGDTDEADDKLINLVNMEQWCHQCGRQRDR
jgi:hypothetical protein